MKRFLSLLTVFVLVFSLTVPVGASSDSKWNYGGIEAPPLLNDSYSILYDDGTGVMQLIVTTVPMYYDVVNNEMEGKEAYTYSLYYSNGDSWDLVDTRKLKANEAVLYRKASWASYDVYDLNGNLVIPFVEPVRPNCDGSSCPATDTNIDGICDDCGMALMSLSRSPVAPEVTGSNKNYVMFYSGTVYKYTVYTSDESYTIRGEEYGARYRTYTDPSVTVTRYESYDGINWEQTYTGKTANDYPGEIGYELISSTFDWYTEAGDRFFPVPLWEEVQTVTQGEMGTLTSETAGTMKTLVVCGVGLMACLMALSLFGKRWLLFLR